MSLPKLTEEDFDKLVKQIRLDYPKLKMRIFKKRDRLPSLASGEYGWGALDVAAGRAQHEDWEWVIGVIAHELAHYVRERRHTPSYNKRVYRANTIFYSSSRPYKERRRAMYWVLRDEYYTDCEAVKLLNKWGLWEYFKYDYWRWAASYNYRIKYYLETGEFVSGVDTTLKAPNRKLTYEEITKPLTKAKIRQIQYIVDTFDRVMVDTDDDNQI